MNPAKTSRLRKFQDEMLQQKMFIWNPESNSGAINFRPCAQQIWRKDLPYLIWRSGTFHNMSADNYKTLINKINIKTHISLLSPVEERTNYLLPINQLNCSLGEIDEQFRLIKNPNEQDYVELYWQYLVKDSLKIAKIISYLARSATLPLLISCYAGKDRTGIICLLLLGLRSTWR